MWSLWPPACHHRVAPFPIFMSTSGAVLGWVRGAACPNPQGRLGSYSPGAPWPVPESPKGKKKSNVSINEDLFVDGIILGFLKYPRRRNPNLKRFPVDRQQRTKPKVGRRGRACLENVGAAVCTAHARGASGSEKDPVF